MKEINKWSYVYFTHTHTHIYIYIYKYIYIIMEEISTHRITYLSNENTHKYKATQTKRIPPTIINFYTRQ